MSTRSVTIKYLEQIFKSHWLLIAMCGPIIVHVYWYSAYLLRGSFPCLLDVFFAYELDFLTTPVMIAICLAVFHVPVKSIAKDTAAVAVGFVVGDLIAFLLTLPTDSDISFALHLSFGTLFMAVCVPSAAMMFLLVVAFKRLKAKKGSAR